MRGVNIIGDSISHGANAPKIPEQSYVGLFKKAADAEWQGGNYGFVSLLAAIDNASGVYKEIHTISRSGSWQTLQTGDFLGAYAMRSAKQGDTLYIKPKTAFRYAAVFYEASPAGGRFEILVNGKSAGIVDTKAPARDTAARTGLFPLNATAKADIQVVSAGGGTVTVTGVGYYNSRNGVVVNNYSRSGLQLVQIEDDTLRMMCRASVVVFAMGHNDMWQDGIDAAFAHKIYVVMQAVKDSKARLIVSDFTWGDPKGRTVRKELKRLADACGGVYHDYAAEMSHQIQDGSPSVSLRTPHPGECPLGGCQPITMERGRTMKRFRIEEHPLFSADDVAPAVNAVVAAMEPGRSGGAVLRRLPVWRHHPHPEP